MLAAQIVSPKFASHFQGLSAPKSRDIFANAIARFYRRPEVAAISGAPWTKKCCDLQVQIFHRKRMRFDSAISEQKMSPWRKRSPAKGVWQKSDEKSDRSIPKSDRKATESVPKTKKSDRTPFAALLLRHPENALFLRNFPAIWPLWRKIVAIAICDFGVLSSTANAQKLPW